MCVTSKDLKTRVSKDSGKTEALTTAPRDKEEALITAPRDKTEALITAPRPSKGVIPGPGPKAEKYDEKKRMKEVPPALRPSPPWRPVTNKSKRSGPQPSKNL